MTSFPFSATDLEARLGSLYTEAVNGTIHAALFNAIKYGWELAEQRRQEEQSAKTEPR